MGRFFTLEISFSTKAAPSLIRVTIKNPNLEDSFPIPFNHETHPTIQVSILYLKFTNYAQVDLVSHYSTKCT